MYTDSFEGVVLYLSIVRIVIANRYKKVLLRDNKKVKDIFDKVFNPSVLKIPKQVFEKNSVHMKWQNDDLSMAAS